MNTSRSGPIDINCDNESTFSEYIGENIRSLNRAEGEDEDSILAYFKEKPKIGNVVSERTGEITIFSVDPELEEFRKTHKRQLDFLLGRVSVISNDIERSCITNCNRSTEERSQNQRKYFKRIYSFAAYQTKRFSILLPLMSNLIKKLESKSIFSLFQVVVASIKRLYEHLELGKSAMKSKNKFKDDLESITPNFIFACRDIDLTVKVLKMKVEAWNPPSPGQKLISLCNNILDS